MQIPQRPVSGQEISREWFGRFWDYVRSLTPISDNKTIKINHYSSGTTFEVIQTAAGGGGSDLYNGSFNIAQKDATTIQIWDLEESDNYDDSTRAGFFLHGLEWGGSNSELEVLSEELIVAGSGDIVAKLEYDVDAETYTTSLVIEAFTPGDATTYNKKIGYVLFNDGKITKLARTWFGDNIEVVGRG